MIFTSPPRVTLVGGMALALKSKRFATAPGTFGALSLRTPPAVSFISTPAMSLEIGNSRAVT